MGLGPEWLGWALKASGLVRCLHTLTLFCSHPEPTAQWGRGGKRNTDLSWWEAREDGEILCIVWILNKIFFKVYFKFLWKLQIQEVIVMFKRLNDYSHDVFSCCIIWLGGNMDGDSFWRTFWLCFAAIQSTSCWNRIVKSGCAVTKERSV